MQDAHNPYPIPTIIQMKIIQRKFMILDPLDRWIFTPLGHSAALMSALGLLAAAPSASAQLLSTTSHQGGDEIVTFTGGSGIWTPPSGVTTVEVLVVGGGGGGGHNGGGGGGAGGLLHSSAFDVSGGTQAVTIGGGGTGSTSGAVAGTAGASSIFGSLTAVGGGAVHRGMAAVQPVRVGLAAVVGGAALRSQLPGQRHPAKATMVAAAVTLEPIPRAAVEAARAAWGRTQPASGEPTAASVCRIPFPA